MAAVATASEVAALGGKVTTNAPGALLAGGPTDEGHGGARTAGVVTPGAAQAASAFRGRFPIDAATTTMEAEGAGPVT